MKTLSILVTVMLFSQSAFAESFSRSNLVSFWPYRATTAKHQKVVTPIILITKEIVN